MMKVFKGGALAVRLRMSSMTTHMGVLTGLMAAGLASPAQVQAQTTQNRLVITNVDVDYSRGQMIIHGRNFATSTGVPPNVHIMEMGMQVVTYGPYTVVVTLPPAFQQPGSYLLTMSTGPNVDQNDSFDVTLGAVGPKGDTGPQGPQGVPGPGANVILTKLYTLTAIVPSCTSSTIQHLSCDSAVHRYCARNGYATGFGLLEYDGANGNVVFACVK